MKTPLLHRLTIPLFIALGFTVMLSCASMTLAAPEPAVSVTVNGQPLQTSVSPIVLNGQVMAPAYPLVSALGGRMQWDYVTQSVYARRGKHYVWMQINNFIGRSTTKSMSRDILKQPPIMYKSTFMAPLAYMVKALGATEVTRKNNGQVVNVSITDSSTPSRGRIIMVKPGAVVRATFDENLSSQSAKIGQGFWVTVISDKSGFPAGARIRGVVTRVLPKTPHSPGVLAVRFTGIRIPTKGKSSRLSSIFRIPPTSLMTSSSINLNIIGSLTSAESASRDTVKSTFIVGNDTLKTIAMPKGSTLMEVIQQFLDGNHGAPHTAAHISKGATVSIRIEKAMQYILYGKK